MSEIIELIKVLRDRTGAGLMDCKKALQENNNDIEASITWLREKGIAKVAKKSSRIAAEGLTHVLVKGDDAVVLEVNSETDFVAHSDPFGELVSYCSEAILECKPGCVNCAKEASVKGGNTIEQSLTDATIKLGEKLDLRRFDLTHKEANQIYGAYIHMKGKISVLVQLEGGNEEIAKGIAMTIAANSPLYITRDDITDEIVAKEVEVQTEIAKNDESLASKPENIKQNIIKNRAEKVLNEQVLASNEYVLDTKKTIAALLTENKAKVLKFVRYQVGEGLEKRQDDFAAEVMNQVK